MMLLRIIGALLIVAFGVVCAFAAVMASGFSNMDTTGRPDPGALMMAGAFLVVSIVLAIWMLTYRRRTVG